MRPRRLVLTAALVAAVVVTVSLSLVGGPAAGPAYASWSAVPRTAPQADPNARPSSTEIRRWSSQCTDLGVGGFAMEGLDPAAASGRRPVLVDRRGDFTFCVDVATGSATEADPLIGLSGLRSDSGPTEGLSGAWTSVSSDPFTPPARDAVLVLGGDTRTPPPEDPAEMEGVVSLEAYQLFGLAGADVRGVDLLLDDGLRITATVKDGVWGAWWPSDKGDPSGVRLEVTTADGATSTAPAADVLLP